jgi:hypothetical protein
MELPGNGNEGGAGMVYQVIQTMSNSEHIRITEAEFMAHEDKELMDFAQLIRDSGVSLYEIAKACNLSWETVKAASNGTPVKFSTQCRIKLYIERKLDYGSTEN